MNPPADRVTFGSVNLQAMPEDERPAARQLRPGWWVPALTAHERDHGLDAPAAGRPGSAAFPLPDQAPRRPASCRR
jgi:hypothetical protein